MNDQSGQFKKCMGSVLLVLTCLCAFLFLMNPPTAVVGQQEAEPAPEDEDFVELAPYMGELQTLTHKLGLSIENSNHTLSEFYLYESLHALEEMKTDVPEYRGHLIAVLVDRTSTPIYKALATAIKEDKAETETTNKRSATAYKALINSCNQCHEVTQHGFIKIAAPNGSNPFLQDFKPAKK